MQWQKSNATTITTIANKRATIVSPYTSNFARHPIWIASQDWPFESKTTHLQALCIRDKKSWQLWSGLLQSQVLEGEQVFSRRSPGRRGKPRELYWVGGWSAGCSNLHLHQACWWANESWHRGVLGQRVWGTQQVMYQHVAHKEQKLLETAKF